MRGNEKTVLDLGTLTTKEVDKRIKVLEKKYHCNSYEEFTKLLISNQELETDEAIDDKMLWRALIELKRIRACSPTLGCP